MYSDKNYFLRFEASQVPEKKKAALGVRGMKIKGKEEITGYKVLRPNMSKKIKTDKGEVNLERLHITSRDQRGTKH